MRPITIFILFILGAFLSGALLAYPLYFLLSFFSRVGFADVVVFATQICGLIFSLAYLKHTGGISLTRLGYVSTNGSDLRSCVYWFLCGLLIILLLGITLNMSGLYGLHPEREISLPSISRLLISALVTGLAVSLFEETVFRGALLEGLRTKTNSTIAIIATSFVYACVHFIAYPEPLTTVNVFTGISHFISAYSAIFRLENFDALGALIILGVLLGLLRVKAKNIVLCISLHAGLVAGIKLFRFFLLYQPETTYDFLVSDYDHRLGIMAMFWLGLATLLYYLLSYRNSSND